MLKSLFVSSSIAFAAFCIGYIFIGKLALWSALGLGLSAGTYLLFFAALFIVPTARTSANLPLVSLAILLGVGISIYGYFITPMTISFLPLILSISTGFAWLVYIFWYSKFTNRNDKDLKKGSVLPYFESKNENGEIVNSNHFKGKHTVWLFFRGNWCPLCMAQIKEVANQYQEMEKKGIQTVLISPQREGHTKKLSTQFNVPFKFLVDADFTIAKQLGLLHKGGLPFGLQVFGYDSDTVMPTVLITNKNNELIYVDQTENYRVRPEPSSFLKVVEDDLKRTS